MKGYDANKIKKGVYYGCEMQSTLTIAYNFHYVWGIRFDSEMRGCA